MAISSSILAWEIPWTEKPAGVLKSMGLQRVRHNLVTEQQQMLVVRVVMRVVRGLGFLLGESHGQRSLVGHSHWGCKQSDRKSVV